VARPSYPTVERIIMPNKFGISDKKVQEILEAVLVAAIESDGGDDFRESLHKALFTDGNAERKVNRSFETAFETLLERHQALSLEISGRIDLMVKALENMISIQDTSPDVALDIAESLKQVYEGSMSQSSLDTLLRMYRSSLESYSVRKVQAKIDDKFPPEPEQEELPF
jgi:hypothetical protein